MHDSFCVIGKHLRDTPEPYRTALARLLEGDAYTGGISADLVAKTMRGAGLKASATAIRLHRAGTCACG